ncbi:MAG: hypothetical protein U1E61_19535 [Bradyrhizobium sp.]
MPSTLKRIDGEAHDAPIAPDIVPADWADCVPHPANDVTSREKLFAEIRLAAEAAAPKVDSAFRATDAEDVPLLDSSSRAWIKRTVTVFAFALVSVIAAAAWQHHGDTVARTAASWVPSPDVGASPAAETAAEPAAQPVADQPVVTSPPALQAPASKAATLPPEAEQQIQSMTRELAAMSQQVEQLKAQIETLKANQQTAVAPAAPAARAPASRHQAPKVTMLPPRPVPVAPPSRPAYPPAAQAAAAPPPPTATAPSSVSPPPQATIQPNGEPVVRPPMPLPLQDRY